jgi:hypothetical protein
MKSINLVIQGILHLRNLLCVSDNTYRIEIFKEETTAAVRVSSKETMVVVMENFKLVSENVSGCSMLLRQ